MPDPSSVRRVKGTLRHTRDQLLLVDAFRFGVAALRWLWLARVRKHLRTVAGTEGVAEHTVSHNLKGLRDLAVNRSLHIVRPLSVVERLDADAELLVIGPRTEGELLAYMAHGFERKRITAVDLISYSPWIDLGDMHELPYPDDSFDAVALGWVLAYSDDPKRAAAEIARVLRPGGVVAVGVEWSPRSDDEIKLDVGYLPGSSQRIESCDAILAVFEPYVDEVLYRHEVAPTRRDRVGALVVIFTTPEATATHD
jgi:SAM-dependent methyltransferase